MKIASSRSNPRCGTSQPMNITRSSVRIKRGTMVHAREGWFAKIEDKENVFVKVTTDEGIVGWGEACAHPVTSETQAGIVSDSRVIWPRHRAAKTRSRLARFTQRSIICFCKATPALAAQLTLRSTTSWARHPRQPVYNLLGGAFQTSFRAVGDDAARLNANAWRSMRLGCWLKRGYTCFEPKMTGRLESLDADADRLEAILRGLFLLPRWSSPIPTSCGALPKQRRRNRYADFSKVDPILQSNNR